MRRARLPAASKVRAELSYQAKDHRHAHAMRLPGGSRQASAILTEMPAPVAAEVAALIVERTHPATTSFASAPEARS